MRSDGYQLLGGKSGGSAIVELLLTRCGAPYAVEWFDWPDIYFGRVERLKALSPVGHVPVLVLPDGSVMTETAAIALHLADRFPVPGLMPLVGDPARPAFLRWLIFLVGTVYPTFTYGDEPSKWVSGAAVEELRASTNARREELWRVLEAAMTPGPWLVGNTLTALDLFVAVMSRWTPKRPWFAEHCPKLYGVACAVEALPDLAPVFARNFE